MKKRISFIILAIVVLFVLVPPMSISSANAVSISFQPTFEIKVWDGSTLYFSRQPVQKREGAKSNEDTYLFAIGTKIAQKFENEFVPISIIGKSGIRGGLLVCYEEKVIEATLREDMLNDKLGVSICGSKRGYGLVDIFIDETTIPNGETPSFNVKFRVSTDGDPGSTEKYNGYLLFSEEPVEAIGDLPLSVEYGAYVFPVGTKIAYKENNSLIDVLVSGATPYFNEIWEYNPLVPPAKEIVLTEEMGADEKGLIITTKYITQSARMNHIWLRIIVEGSFAAGISEDYQKVLEWNTKMYNSKNISDANTLSYFLKPSAKIQSNDKHIIELATALTNGIKSDVDKAAMIYEWVGANIWYDYDCINDKSERRENSALSTLNERVAVCEGYTALTIALLRASGIPAKVILGISLEKDNPACVKAYYDFDSYLDIKTLNKIGDHNGSHAWLEAYIDGKWIIIDPTWATINRYEDGKFSTEIGFAGMMWFDVSLKRLSYTHRIADIPLESSADFYSGDDRFANETPSEWAKPIISDAIDAGLVPSKLQKNYTMPVSRANVSEMFVKLLEKSAGKSIEEIIKDKGVSINEKTFSDTTDKYILAANALGILNGVGDGKFGPDGTLTRAEIAAVINRIAKVMGVETSGYKHSFTDVSGHWSDKELGWPASVGILDGVGNGKFNPNGKLTTEQAIKVVYTAFSVLR